MSLFASIGAFGFYDADAKIIPNDDDLLTMQESKKELERVLSNIEYEKNQHTYMVETKDLQDVLNLRHIDITLPTLSYDALRGYNRTSGFNSGYYIPYNKNITKLVIDHHVPETKEERIFAQNKLDEIEDFIVKNYELKTTYQVISAINDYMVKNFKYTYDNGKYDIYSMEHMLITGKGVCQAYTAIAQELLERFNIESKIILGYLPNTTEFSGLHTWLGVKIDGEWFNFDVTWNDPLYLEGQGVPTTKKYLAVSNKFLENDYAPRVIYNPVPANSSTVNQYEPYSYKKNKDVYLKNRYNKYIENFWVTNYDHDGNVIFELMDYNPSYTYELKINQDNKVFLNINNKHIVPVNNLKNKELLKKKLVRYKNVSVKDGVITVKFSDKTTQIRFEDFPKVETVLPVKQDYKDILKDNVVLNHPFKDIKGLYAEKEIQILYNKKVIKGTSADTYAPYEHVKVGQVVGILGRYLGYEEKSLGKYAGFKNHWAENHYKELVNNNIYPKEYLGILSGHAYIKREEVINIIYNLLLKNGLTSVDTSSVIPFKDKDKFSSSYLHEKALVLRYLEIFEGNQLNHVMPDEELTRLQLAKVISKTFHLIENK